MALLKYEKTKYCLIQAPDLVVFIPSCIQQLKHMIGLLVAMWRFFLGLGCDEQRPLTWCQHFTLAMYPERHACRNIINRCEKSPNDLSLKVCWAIMMHLHGSEYDK